MPTAGVHFIKASRYSVRSALGLTYAATLMLLSARRLTGEAQSIRVES
jgi:hypothetical protein